MRFRLAQLMVLAAAILGLSSPYLASRFGAQAAVVMVRLAPLPLFALMIFFPMLWIAVLAHVVRTASINMGWPIDSGLSLSSLPPRMRTIVKPAPHSPVLSRLSPISPGIRKSM